MKKSTILFAVLLANSIIAQNALIIPDTLSGTSISLSLQNGIHQFYSGQNTSTMGANGNILGPTLLLNQGDFINFSVFNQLADSTTIHWHGLHVSPENDGGPHTAIAPNSTWNPSFTILDKAATYWYHPHLHHKTNEHVTKGIAGLIIVRDSEESNLALPRAYGIDDFPLVIQTKDFDINNEIIVKSNSDDVVMVNATIDPFLQVPAQVVRYRILNASSQRSFNIGLSNNQVFHQIASDGGLLSNPFQTTRILIAPGERAEILIDLTGMTGQSIFIKSFSSELPNGIYGATNPGMNASLTLNGYNPNPLNGSDFDILQLNIVAQTPSPITIIPTNLVNVTPIPESSANITRNLSFSPAVMGMNQLNENFLINGDSFNMNVINYTIPLNNTEIWELTNQSAISHPFHIHDVQFYVLTRDGLAPPINEQGRKDVVLVKPQEVVRFIAKFSDFANSLVPYMYHCHLLPHEDGGMMGQFIVNDTSTTLLEAVPSMENVSIFPNPSKGTITIQFNGKKPAKIEAVNILGKKVLSSKLFLPQEKHILSSLPKGLLILNITTSEGNNLRKKVIIN